MTRMTTMTMMMMRTTGVMTTDMLWSEKWKSASVALASFCISSSCCSCRFKILFKDRILELKVCFVNIYLSALVNSAVDSCSFHGVFGSKCLNFCHNTTFAYGKCEV